ncbi:peptidase [Phormidesmis priestleyi]
MSVWKERQRSRFLRAIVRLGVFCRLGCLLLLCLPLCLQPSDATLLPAPQVHPLPATLAQMGARSQGDYFDQIQKTQPEYLVWSQFPIKVYVEPVADGANRAEVWVKAVQTAIQEWNAFLPLQEVSAADQADIRVLRSPIPLRSPNARAVRARSAETRYELYAKQISNQAILAHRCVVVVRPNQAIEYVLASARHELGHALGIWGHSPLQTDALYFSQVRNPPLISPRDVNTLRRIYEQPTRLGWVIP